MLLAFLIIWALCGSDPSLARPWSGWFVWLFVIAVLTALWGLGARTTLRSRS